MKNNNCSFLKDAVFLFYLRSVAVLLLPLLEKKKKTKLLLNYFYYLIAFYEPHACVMADKNDRAKENERKKERKKGESVKNVSIVYSH